VQLPRPSAIADRYGWVAFGGTLHHNRLALVAGRQVIFLSALVPARAEQWVADKLKMRCHHRRGWRSFNIAQITSDDGGRVSWVIAEGWLPPFPGGELGIDPNRKSDYYPAEGFAVRSKY